MEEMDKKEPIPSKEYIKTGQLHLAFCPVFTILFR